MAFCITFMKLHWKYFQEIAFEIAFMKLHLESFLQRYSTIAKCSIIIVQICRNDFKCSLLMLHHNANAQKALLIISAIAMAEISILIAGFPCVVQSQIMKLTFTIRVIKILSYRQLHMISSCPEFCTWSDRVVFVPIFVLVLWFHLLCQGRIKIMEPCGNEEYSRRKIMHFLLSLPKKANMKTTLYL